ncbi:hypothetical protein SMC92_001114 [Cronobacter dublinensis]|nr:hypothetical protein [Cronobacter dublinensis]
MKEFKGTPGPWSLDEFDNVVHGEAPSHGWVRKETVRVSGVALPGRVTEEYAANTRLVAAAPDLLVALQEMTAIVKKNSYPQPDKPSSNYARAEWAESIISKALGEE